MSLSTQGSKLSQLNWQLLKTLNRLRRELSLDHPQWLEILDLTPEEYRKVFLEGQPVPLYNLVQTTEKFDLNLDAVMTGKIDYQALSAHFRGNSSYVPEKYLRAGFSRRRTVVNILDFSELYFGSALRKEALRHFQITEMALSHLDAPINIHLITDILGFLKKKGLDEAGLFNIGAHSVITHRNSQMAKALKNFREPSAAYEEAFLNLISFYERNCHYQLKRLNSTHCVVESVTTEEVSDILSLKQVGSQDVCTYRSGVMASTLGYLGLPFAKVVEKTCVHRGDLTCRFEINFEDARAVANQQEKRRLVLST